MALTRKFKITLWLQPEEYYQLMKSSADLESGKLSMHKLFKARFALEAKKEVPKRTVSALVRHMHVKPQLHAVAAAARRPRSPRKLLAA